MKRCMSICCVLTMALGLSFGVSTDAQAASSIKVIDGSKLTQDAESTGYSQNVARGKDLMSGYSKVVRMGPGEIYAGGTTIAAHEVERIGVGVMIERAFLANTDRVASTKYLDVEGDYYYRVRCVHSAGEDMSSSFTDGVYIEKP